MATIDIRIAINLEPCDETRWWSSVEHKVTASRSENQNAAKSTHIDSSQLHPRPTLQNTAIPTSPLDSSQKTHRRQNPMATNQKVTALILRNTITHQPIPLFLRHHHQQTLSTSLIYPLQ
jgi:hypothetical protein